MESTAEMVKPLPALMRPPVRWVLRRWARSGRKYERLTHAINKWGARAACGPLPTRLPNGCEMVCEVADHVQRYTYFRGLYESVESYLFTLLLRRGMTVIDVGANTGQYTLLAATAVGSEGAVHSFEPVPANFRQLESNITRNHLSNVTAVCGALWDEETEVALSVPKKTPGQSANSGQWSVGAPSGEMRPVGSKAFPLDTYAQRHHLQRIDFMKMDVEGAEPFVIRGARQVISNSHPIILAEVNQAALQRLGSSAAEFLGLLISLGYRAWKIGSSDDECAPVSDAGSLAYANVIFHQDDLPPAVTSGWSRRTPRQWACSGW